MKFRHLLALLAVMCLPVLGFAQDKTTMPAPAKPGATKIRKMPARDPKTGRFMKSDKSKMGGKMPGMSGKMRGKMRKMPARDPKTGRFMKSGTPKPGSKM